MAEPLDRPPSRTATVARPGRPSFPPVDRPGRPVPPVGQRRLAIHGLSALLTILLSLGVLVASAGLDGYFQRGVVWGTPAPAPATGGPLLGMNVFLEKEADRENIVRSVRMLQEAHVTFVRQTFSWAEIEPAPGQYVDPKTGQSSWGKYDFIVDQLRNAGIGILARVDTIPRWARAPTDDFARWDKAPPQDFNNYANFVATLAARYRGKIDHFQVWNEPNLQGEWGGRPISPEQYGLLLKYTYPKVKQANPNAFVVTAGLAQTTERGPTNLDELDFIQGLYNSGAGSSFDILSVMDYGLGTSPNDRRVSPSRVNFSRLQLAREIMVRNGDAAKPIWVSEYGWLSLPPNWQGRPSTWGPSVSEDVQAQYLVAGLDRMRAEWPWVGAAFVWAFRWVEPASAQPNDPARYFEVVDHDFTPRPAFVALSAWATKQAIAPSGPLDVHDARIAYTGRWHDQEVGGRTYRVADGPGSELRLAFHGADLHLLTRTGPKAGRVYVTVDGQEPPGLPTDARGAYVSLYNSAVIDRELTLASNLANGDHFLVLRAPDDGSLALTGLSVGRRQPFPWVTPFLFASALTGLFAGLLLALRVLAMAAGWLPPPGAAPRRQVGVAWWDTRE